MKKHLAIFTKNAIRAIISGQKTIETRFSKKKIAPFGMVNVGDLIYMKPPGEELAGQFVATKVLSLEGIEEQDWKWINQEFGKRLSFGSEEEMNKYFKEHEGSKFATIIYLGKIEQFVTSPIKVVKRDLRGWLVIDEEKHLDKGY